MERVWMKVLQHLDYMLMNTIAGIRITNIIVDFLHLFVVIVFVHALEVR